MKATLVCSLLMISMVAGAGLTFAHDPGAATEPGLGPEPREHLRDRFMERRGRLMLRREGLRLLDGAFQVAGDPVRAALLQIRRIDRIYRERNDLPGLEAFYQELLSRTDNAAVRNVVWIRLGELRLETEDADGALEDLRQGLEENLERLR